MTRWRIIRRDFALFRPVLAHFRADLNDSRVNRPHGRRSFSPGCGGERSLSACQQPPKLAALERCKVSEVEIYGVIPGNYFSDAIMECHEVYESGHFIATVMVTQAVAERLLKFIAEKSEVMGGKKVTTKDFPCLLDLKDSPLLKVLPYECVEAFKKICDSRRNDVIHVNPGISKINFPEQAKENIECLGLIKCEIFALRPTDNPGRPELERFTIGCSPTGVGVLCPRAEGRSEAASLFPPGGYTES